MDDTPGTPGVYKRMWNTDGFPRKNDLYQLGFPHLLVCRVRNKSSLDE